MSPFASIVNAVSSPFNSVTTRHSSTGFESYPVLAEAKHSELGTCPILLSTANELGLVMKHLIGQKSCYQPYTTCTTHTIAESYYFSGKTVKEE